jgi:diadenosine tetraphosphate (Ap4A) HIT family hydrolase
MNLDQLIEDHSPENLEIVFDSIYLYKNDFYSLLAKKTEMPWLIIIPKQDVNGQNIEFVKGLYSSIYLLADFLQEKGLGKHYNLAKIGNKNPFHHLHLIFRDENDEVWPDAVWCHEPLKASSKTTSKLNSLLSTFKA